MPDTRHQVVRVGSFAKTGLLDDASIDEGLDRLTAFVTAEAQAPGHSA